MLKTARGRKTDMSIGNQDSRRISIVILLLIIPISAIFVFSIWSFQFVAKIPFESVNEDLPATVIFLLEFGLAIISIAVAVWIGLNIYNVIAKNDLFQLEQKLAELAKMEQRLAAARQNQSAAEKSMLLSSLVKTQNDFMSSYYISKIAAMDDREVDPSLFAILVFIEDAFANTLDGYNKRNRDAIENHVALGLSYCSRLFDELDSYTHSKSKDCPFKEHFRLFQSYLYFRRAEFLFYSNVRPSTPPMCNTEEGRMRCCDGLLKAIEDYTSAERILTMYDTNLPKRCRSYLNNSIGYSYSEKYHYGRVSVDLYQAKERCRAACYPDGELVFTASNYDTSYLRSFYLRNYAHCIEGRKDDLTQLAEAQIHYKRSLSIDYRDPKAHFNVASIALRIIVVKENIGEHRTQCLSTIAIKQDYNEIIDGAIKNLCWAIKFDSYFTDPYFFLTHAYTLKMLAAKTVAEREQFFHLGWDYMDTYKKLSPSDSMNSHLFYERNLYEAHGDIGMAYAVNRQINHSGDSDGIARLYRAAPAE